MWILIKDHVHCCSTHVYISCGSIKRWLSVMKMFFLMGTTQCLVHMTPQTWSCWCQVFYDSEQNEKVRQADRISQHDLFTPHLSQPLSLSFSLFVSLSPCPRSFLPSWQCWHWVAPKSHSSVWVLGYISPSLCSHVLTIFLVLCEIMQIF